MFLVTLNEFGVKKNVCIGKLVKLVAWQHYLRSVVDGYHSAVFLFAF